MKTNSAAIAFTPRQLQDKIRQDRGWRPEAEAVVDSRTRLGCDKYALGSRVFGSPIVRAKTKDKASQDKDNDTTGQIQDKDKDKGER